jgi:hypothetical protein
VSSRAAENSVLGPRTQGGFRSSLALGYYHVVPSSGLAVSFGALNSDVEGEAAEGPSRSGLMPLWLLNQVLILQQRGKNVFRLPKGVTTIAQPFKVGYERARTHSVPKGTADSIPEVPFVVLNAMFPQ